MSAFSLFLASLEDEGRRKESLRRTNVTSSSVPKSSKSTRISSAPKNLKHGESTPHISANIARDFVLATPKKPKPISVAANNMHATPHINTNVACDFVLATPKKPKSINSANSMDGGSVPLGSSLILFKHQAMDLEWLLEREKAEQGGSILAHEMGLGKTITSITLIKKTLQEWKTVDLRNLTVVPSSRTRGSGKVPLARPKTTLVVVPSVSPRAMDARN